MALTIGEFKQANPEYASVDDFDLARYLHEKYYNSMPFDKFAKQVGVENPEAPGDISRGFSTGTEQLKQTGYGILAAAGAIGEKAFGEGGLSTGLKKAGLAGYKEQEEKIAETAKPSDEATYSLEKAREGDFGALADWVQYGIGQAGNQAIQALATAGLGGFIAKQGVQYAGKELAAKLVEAQAAKIAETEATKIAAGKLTKEAIQQEATKIVADKLGNIGATTALGGLALTQEGGEIGGDLVAKAEKEGRTLTGGELAKAFGYSLGAGALEFVGDKFGLDVLTGKTKFGKTLGEMQGAPGRIARGTAAGLTTAPVEAGTEYGQTLLEEAGKGNDPFSEQARLNAINAAAQGALGGHVMGMAGGILTSPITQIEKQPEADPIVKIATAKSTDEVITNASQALSEPTNVSREPVPGNALVNEAEVIQDRIDKYGLSRDEAIRTLVKEGYLLQAKPLEREAGLQPWETPTAGILSAAKPEPVIPKTEAEIADEWEQQDLANQEAQTRLAEKQLSVIGEPAPEELPTKEPETLGKKYDFEKPVTPIKDFSKFSDKDLTDLYREAEPYYYIPPIDTPEYKSSMESFMGGIEAEQERRKALKEKPPAEQPVETAKPLPEAGTPVIEKPVQAVSEFTPTHELNDGTPVVKVEGEINVYKDAAGNEWESDDAEPVKETPIAANKEPIAPITTNKQYDAYVKAINQYIADGTIKEKSGLIDQIEVDERLTDQETQDLIKLAKQGVPELRKGEVGGQLMAGEIVTTSSGRQTTPFPKFQTKEGNIKAVHLKAVDKWLMKNAFEEAKARGDEFNARQFEANLEKPSQADKDSAEEYLFGKQPEIKKSILKPLETEKLTPINSAALKRKADSLIEKANRMESAGGNKDVIKTLRDQAERDYKAAGIKPVATEMDALKDQMGQAIGELASLLGGKTNLTEEEETKLIPIMSKIFRIAAKMGYVKFKDAAQHVMAQIRELAGDEIADKLSIENLQAGYINIAKEIGGDKLEALQYESIQELEKDQNAIEKQKTSTPNAGSSAQSGVRKEGEDTAESRQGIRGGGQEERDIGQIIPKGWTKTSSGMMTNPDEKSGGIIDTNAISKKWFFVSNNDAITNQEGFDSWQNAYDALQNALQKIGIKKSENDLVSLFNKLGKQGISKSGESLIKQRSNADIITEVQNHWLDVLADIGYEKENKSDNPNGKVFIQC